MFNLKNAVFPTPVYIEEKGNLIKIANVSKGDFSFEFEKGGDMLFEAAKCIENAFSEKCAVKNGEGRYKITLIADENNENFKDIASSEAYFIDINKERALLCGKGEAGAYYAAVTFKSIISVELGEVFIPECTILDYPRFPMRAHFMEDRYGSDFMSLDDWKAGIDYLSEMKINAFVVGVYGCWSRQYDGQFSEYLYIPFDKYPELKTPRHIKYYSAKEKKLVYEKDVLPVMFEDDYFGKMIEYGKKKNVKIFPLFNSLGHNTLLPRVFPEISAIDENGNLSKAGFCTNNEKTYEIMFDIYDHIIDKYLVPNGIDSFAIGLDEVGAVRGIDKNNIQDVTEPFCKCEKCRNAEYGDLMIDYIIRIANHLKGKGINNVYVYHDMLFKYNLINEETAEKFKKEGVYDVIVIDWWNYLLPEKIFRGRRGEINSVFRSVGKPMTGYFHWSMPTQMNCNIYCMSEIAEENNFEGLIAYSTFEHCYDFNYRVFSECSWRGNDAVDLESLLSRYASVMFPENPSGAYSALKSLHDIMLGRYSFTNYCANIFEYYTSSYLKAEEPYPQNYPANAFKKVLDDEENKYIPYFKETLQKAEYAYNFFNDNISSQKGDIWKLIAAQYMTLCDEFLTILTCADQYKNGEIDEFFFVSELNRLISQREKTMALCEDVRIKANQYTCLRNMSVSRQFICDFRDYMENEIKSGRKPEVDIAEFGKYLSASSWFLR